MASRERRRTEAYQIAARNIHRGRTRKRHLARMERESPGAARVMRSLDRWFRRVARAIDRMGTTVHEAASDVDDLLKLIDAVPYGD